MRRRTGLRLSHGHTFDTWGVLRVTLQTDSRNARSRRAIKRIGGRENLTSQIRSNSGSDIAEDTP